MTYHFGDLKAQGRSAAEVVKKLREATEFDQSSSDQEWMDDAAERAHIGTGKKVRTSSASAFLDDMVEAGLIQVVQ